MQPFVSALGTELGLTSKEIADIIWLALQMQNSDGTTETPIELSTPAEATDDRSRPSSENFILRTDQDEQPNRASQTKSAEVHLNQASFGKQLALKVPDARSLREPLALARSLKPLLRRVVTGWSTVLDEAATVDRIAAEHLWLPVLKPALEPWLDLALVVDEIASMQLWQRTIAELQRLLFHYGVFRDVRVWGLVTDARGQVQLRPGLGVAARRQAARRPSELLDPSGRRLILVATDCVSSGWQDGSLLPALKLWATSGPLAIIQMLPEWLWSRTGLGFASAVRLQALLPGVPNQQLIAKDLSPWDEVDLEAGLKVPVVTLEPEPFAAWTEMVMGQGGAWSPGVVFESEVVNPNGQVAQLSEVATEDSAEQRVQRFRVTASPMARRLAGLLAAAPVISLPVVRIIQDRLLSESRQVHVAEVFLGSLLKPLGEMPAETNPDAVQYDFLDRVREALLESVPTSDSVNVLEEVSKFVAERLGLSLDAFMAVLRNPQQTEDRELASQSRPFAMVTAQILRQLGGEYARLAEELGSAYATSSTAINLESIWNQILERLKLLLARPVYEAWIETSVIKELSETRLVLQVANQFAYRWLTKYYKKLIENEVQEILGHPIQLQMIVADKEQGDFIYDDSLPPFAVSTITYGSTSLNPKCVFSNFVVGSSNRMAHAASLAVAESSGREFNPLFLCGGDGLGKTHLMQAIAHYRLEVDSNACIIYVTCEQFTSDLITAIRKDDVQSFRESYRSADILLVDDIQFIEGKEYTQEEFFHTFNALYEAGKQVIFTSDRPPNQIPRLQERLCSRFAMGLIADIQPPDLETRMAILLKKAEYENVLLPPEIIEHIASSYPYNIREMEGALTSAIAHFSLLDLPMTVQNLPLVLTQPNQQMEVTPEIVISMLSDMYGVSIENLKSSSRQHETSRVRQIGMYIMHKHTNLSLSEIGKFFGGRNSTTVMRTCEKIALLKEKDLTLANSLRQLSDQIALANQT